MQTPARYKTDGFQGQEPIVIECWPAVAGNLIYLFSLKKKKKEKKSHRNKLNSVLILVAVVMM